MIRVLKQFAKQLNRVQRKQFCSVPPSDTPNSPPNSTQGAQQQPLTKGPQQTFSPKKNQAQPESHKQKQQQQVQPQSNLQGSKINAGTKEDVKKSIEKSVEEFATQFKLKMKKDNPKVGNKSTFELKGDRNPIAEKTNALLQQLKPTEEPLQKKYVGNIPILQQVYADRLRKYSLRISDTKRLQELLKEEEGVDFSYVEPRNLDILHSHIHKQSEEMEEMIANYLGVNQTLSKAEQLEEWRKQQAMENIDFTPETMGKPETFYPGSPKGPHPLDDPQNYLQWYDKNCPLPYRPIVDQMIQIAEMRINDNHMPSFIKKWVKDVREDPQDIIKRNKEEEDDDEDSGSDIEGSEDEDDGLGNGNSKVSTQQQEDLEAQISSVVGGGLGVFFYKSGTQPRLNIDNSALWYIDQNDELPEDISPEEQIINSEGNITFHSGLEDYEVPAYPEKISHQVTHYQIPVVDKWSIFRQFPNMYHWWKNLVTEHQRLSNRPHTLYEFQGLPSLYTYYHTLPDFARNSVIVQNVARCFEFHRHEFSHQQKMMALNFAAKFTLPIDDLVAHAANQMIVSNKHFLTGKEEEKLKTVTQFYLEADPEAFAIHLAQEEHTIEQIENYPAPKKLTADEIEEELCQLPLEYYDNDDGFWNDFIKQKYNRNHNAYPTTTSRPFFKH